MMILISGTVWVKTKGYQPNHVGVSAIQFNCVSSSWLRIQRKLREGGVIKAVQGKLDHERTYMDKWRRPRRRSGR